MMAQSDLSQQEYNPGLGTEHPDYSDLSTVTSKYFQFKDFLYADDGTNLSSFALIALITVSAAILVGIPMVYMLTTYLPSKRRQTRAHDVEDPRKALDQAALGLTAARVLPPNMPQIETVLPEITDQQLVSRNDEMRKLRYQAMKAAKVTTKYETPMTKIQRISLTKYMLPSTNVDYDWLINGVQKCQRWKIETENDQLSITSRRTIEDTLDSKRFQLPVWIQKLTKRDLRKTKLAKPPPIPADLPPCPTDNDITRADKLDTELEAVQERRDLLEQQRKLASVQRSRAKKKAAKEEQKKAETVKVAPEEPKPEAKTTVVEDKVVKPKDAELRNDVLVSGVVTAPGELNTPHISVFPWNEELKLNNENQQADKEQNKNKGNELKNKRAFNKKVKSKTTENNNTKPKNPAVPMAIGANHEEKLNSDEKLAIFLPAGDGNYVGPLNNQEVIEREKVVEITQAPNTPGQKATADGVLITIDI